MYYPNYIGKDWIDPISGQPVNPMASEHQTPMPRQKTVREELEEQALLYEQKQREQQLQQTITPPLPPYLEFNGQELAWYDNGKKYRSWPAQSGRIDYQSPEYQDVADGGPIPEGEWLMRQDRFQNFDDLSTWDKVKSYGGGGKWPGATYSWGNHRVWLEPKNGTNTYGRSEFSTHGGNEFGSAGCIDLEQGMDDFANTFRNYGKDLKVKVKYPQGSWNY